MTGQRRWVKWTPTAAAPVTFVTDGEQALEATLILHEALVWLPEEAGGAPSLELELSCDLATYELVEGRRWFGVPVGFAAHVEAGFTAAQPVHLQLRLAPEERLGLPLGLLLGDTAEDDLPEALIGPLLERERWFPTRNPYNYRTERAWQVGPDGEGRGFDRAAIVAFDGEAV